MIYKLVAPIGISLIAAFIFLPNINRYPLKNWDEAWYAEITKNMASGDYNLLVPFWNGQYFFDKPPLYFWLSLPFFKFFGPGEWQARIVTEVAAIFATLLVFLIGEKLFSKKVGILSTMVFLTLGHVIGRFSEADLDALLIFLFLLSFYSYLFSNRKKIFSVFTGISIGLGILVKGWLIGIFPLFLITVYALFTEKRAPRNWPIIIIVSAITSGWYFLAGFFKFRKIFLDWYLLSPAAGSLSTPLNNFSLAYFDFFLLDFGFWLIPIIFFILFLKKEKFPKLSTALSLATAVILFLLSLNFLNEKLDWYTLPAYPLVGLVVGYFLERLLKARFKLGVSVLISTLLLQFLVVYKIETRYKDRSYIGASLGKEIKTIIPPEDIVILDDHDFTSFLFYSDHQKVYEASKNGGKAWEWWTIKYKEIPNFVQTQRGVYLLSTNPQNLELNLANKKKIDLDYGYKLIKLQK